MGETRGEGFSWSSCLGWSGRLEKVERHLSLITNRPGLVLDLGPGEGSLAGPTVFCIQTGKFRIMSTEFFCNRVIFPLQRFFLMRYRVLVGGFVVRYRGQTLGAVINWGSEGWSGG